MKKTLKLAISLVSLVAVDLAFAPKVGDAQALPAACASANVSDPQTGKPIGFLTGPEFLNNGSMTLQDIRNYLRRDDIKSWYAGDAKTNLIEDTDSTPSNPVFIDFAQLVFDHAAYPNDTEKPPVSKKPINPQLILTMIRKESSTLQLRKKPDISQLACVAGCGCVKGVIHTIRSQIACAARSLRNRFDELAKCGDTINAWNLNQPKQTQDSINVTPTNASTVANFAYNPVAGKQWGGNTDKGANALFCILWHRDLRFAQPPASLTLAPTNPTLTCSDPLGPPDRRNVTFSVSGGTPPYTWSSTDASGTITKGVISACGANGEDAVLKPPANNPGAFAGVVAYTQWASIGGCSVCGTGGDTRCGDVQGCSGINHCCCKPPQDAGAGMKIDRSCDVQILGGPTQGGCGHPDNPGGPACTGTICVDPCGPMVTESQQCATGLGWIFHAGGAGGWLSENPNVGCLQDRRTLEMKANGCRPCGLEMKGAVVTVTDAAGPPVSTPVAVQ